MELIRTTTRRKINAMNLVNSSSKLTRTNTLTGGVGAICKDQTLLISKSVLLDEKVKPVCQLPILGRRIWIVYQHYSIWINHDCLPTSLVPIRHNIVERNQLGIKLLYKYLLSPLASHNSTDTIWLPWPVRSPSRIRHPAVGRYCSLDIESDWPIK